MLHGNSANAWWWQPTAEQIGERFRILALDQRGHGDSEWVRPPAYHPADYVADLSRLIDSCVGGPPILVGHSMGAINALAFASVHRAAARAVVAVDVALSSSVTRDRYLRRLNALPVVVYPDLATAKARFRLMPNEGKVPRAVLEFIAQKSLVKAGTRGYTLKFDRESFSSINGIDVLKAVGRLRVPTLLVRGALSRIMTEQAAQHALRLNSRVELKIVAGAHHHVLIEKPMALARLIRGFVARLEQG
jgi:pimeloyl-ACP methyl ester carboxylesterase